MKTLKKLTAVLLSVLLVAGLFASCGGKKPADEEESTTSAPALSAEDFKKSTFGIATALSIGMRFFDDDSYIDNPSVLWNTIGWYLCYQAENGGNDYLTRTQVNALQHALRPGEELLPAPEMWVKGGSLVVEEVDGETRYSFPAFPEDYKTITDALKPELSVIDGTYVKVILTDELNADNENGGIEEYVFGFKKDPSEGSEFPFVLTEMELPEVQTAIEPEQPDFDIDMLYEQNRVSNLVDIYKTIRMSTKYHGEEVSTSNYFFMDGKVAMTSRYQSYTGEYMYSGRYDDIFFTRETFPDSDETYLSTSDYFSIYEENEITPDDGRDPDEMVYYGADYEIAYNIEFGQIENLVEERGGIYSFDIVSTYGIDDDAFTSSVHYRIDKGSLALKEIIYEGGTEEETVITFTYGEEIDTYNLLDSWDAGLRTVTIVAVLHNDNGDEIQITRKYEVPENMEIVPYCPRGTAIWADRGFTKPYTYRNNLGDYTFYVTDAMG